MTDLVDKPSVNPNIHSGPTPGIVEYRVPTDDELMGAIREGLISLVKYMNIGRERGIKTLFQIKPYEAANPQNPDAPYVLMSLDMVKRFHNGQS